MGLEQIASVPFFIFPGSSVNQQGNALLKLFSNLTIYYAASLSTMTVNEEA
jgi:hypothetical protein